eukprot:gnl/MRDRNA2_/MRDRNA2_166014_c0_seq1.p1 gnl/MRDRNA2_/MRDRNA2_166014_c0~~gnl/MRDRNA2_/MRDRNA2_166014_c0_seq1.p1  ORF type:complete len:264 (-),score=47.50 gnl/MRDRNA2_/MRDRNA2_166014_c0_seq1:29-820(-)
MMAQPAPSQSFPYDATNGAVSLMDQLLIIEREKAELRKLVDDQCAVARSLRSEVDGLEHENESLRSINSSLSVRVQSLERRVGRFSSLAQRIDGAVSSAKSMEAVCQPSWTTLPSPALAAPLDNAEALINAQSLNMVSAPPPASALQLAPAQQTPSVSFQHGKTEPVGSLSAVPEQHVTVGDGEAARGSLGEVQFGTLGAALADKQNKRTSQPLQKLDTSSKIHMDECPASPKTAKDSRKSQWGDSSPKGQRSPKGKGSKGTN